MYSLQFIFIIYQIIRETICTVKSIAQKIIKKQSMGFDIGILSHEENGGVHYW